MSMEVLGIHHVTAITSDPQANIDFYAGVLGLRLVKVTVNFDDPQSYHLYYGDERGQPGQHHDLLRLGRRASGADRAAADQRHVLRCAGGFAAVLGAAAGEPGRHGPRADRPVRRDGAALQRSGRAGSGAGRRAGRSAAAWANGPVPARHAIRGVHSVTLAEEGYERTAALLTETLGFAARQEQDARFRYLLGGGSPGRSSMCCACRTARRGGWAWARCTTSPGGRRTMRSNWPGARAIARAGLNVTPVRDRMYFRSIYFREPGGVLFEIATDSPGFAIDEPRRAPGFAPAAAAVAGADAAADRAGPAAAGPAGCTGGGDAMTNEDLGFVHVFEPGSAAGAAADAPAAARHGRQREGPAGIRAGAAAGCGTAEPARQGARGRQAAVVPPHRRGGVRPGGPAAADAASWQTSSRWRRRRTGSIRSGWWRSATPTGRTSRRRCCCLRPDVLAGAILLRPMVPVRPDPLPNLRGKGVLIAGRAERSDRAVGADGGAGGDAADSRGAGDGVLARRRA